MWVVGLHHEEAGEYVYGVTQLDVSEGDAPTWLIRIASGFDSWVSVLQYVGALGMP